METYDKIQLFEDKRIRTAWDSEREEWYFSIVDVIGVLTDSKDPPAYWRKLKQRLRAEGSERGCKKSPPRKKSSGCLKKKRQPLRICDMIKLP